MNDTYTIIGKTVLVDLTYLDSDGEVAKELQLYGPVKTIVGNTLTFTRTDLQEDFSIPFVDDLFATDEEFTYTLHTTGEVVSGVNFLASFTITP